MTTRTVKVMGMGFGATPASIVATVNGTQVFSGTVTTLDSPMPALPDISIDDDVELFSFTIDVDGTYSSNVAVSLQVSGNPIVLTEQNANYSQVINPIFSEEQWTVLTNPAESYLTAKLPIYESLATPAFSSGDIATLSDKTIPQPDKDAIYAAHGVSMYVRTADLYRGAQEQDVSINGVPQTIVPGDLTGTWWWKLSPSDTIAYTLVLN